MKYVIEIPLTSVYIEWACCSESFTKRSQMHGSRQLRYNVARRKVQVVPYHLFEKVQRHQIEIIRHQAIPNVESLQSAYQVERHTNSRPKPVSMGCETYYSNQRVFSTPAPFELRWRRCCRISLSYRPFRPAPKSQRGASAMIPSEVHTLSI